MSEWCHEHNRPAETCWICHPNHSTLRNWRRVRPHVPEGHDSGMLSREDLAGYAGLSLTTLDDATGAYRDNGGPTETGARLALHSIRRGAGAGYWLCNCRPCLGMCWPDYEQSKSRSLHRWWLGEVRPTLDDPANGFSEREIRATEIDYGRLMEDFHRLGI